MTETAPTCPITTDQLAEAIQRNVGEKAPAPLRMMTARGLAPMPPADLVTAQFILTFDADDKIAKTAEKGLTGLDQRIANAVLSDTKVHPEVLGYLAQIHATNDAYAEKLLLNPSVPAEAFPGVAAVCSEAIGEIITNNQARILEQPEIVQSLAQNPNILRSSLDRVIDFLVRSGVMVEGMREFEEALLRLGAEERLKAADNIEIPPELLDDQFLSDEDQAERDRQLIDEDEEDETSKGNSPKLEELLRTLNVAQLVALGTKGKRSARRALLRHTNRMVAIAAVSSPMISEPEIIEACNSKVTHTDAIGFVLRDKKDNWVRNYQVKLALVNNPKTPLPDAMRLVPSLNARDLKATSKSRNVPQGVRNLANKLSKGRMGGRR